MLAVRCLTTPAQSPWPQVAKLPPAPQCEAQRVTAYLNDTPATSKRCARSSKFVVGGKHLCLRHAEIAALVYLLEQQP